MRECSVPLFQMAGASLPFCVIDQGWSFFADSPYLCILMLEARRAH